MQNRLQWIRVLLILVLFYSSAAAQGLSFEEEVGQALQTAG